VRNLESEEFHEAMVEAIRDLPEGEGLVMAMY
jgi:hypothetical protein